MSLNDKKSLHIHELDLLRGLAAIFMVVNHMGFGLLGEDSSPGVSIITLLFITSFAPVLFFFTTGLGTGLQSTSKPKTSNFSATLYKFVLLIIADLFLAFGKGRLFGLDFLGYIAIIVLLLDLIRNTRHPILITIISMITIFLLRFAIAPKIVLDDNSFFQNLASWVLGQGVENVSYPFSPWFIYPLLGFLIGAIVGRQTHAQTFIQSKRNLAILLGTAIIFGLASALLYKLDYSFFRWGTIGIGFFAISFAIIAAAILTVIFVHKLQKNNLLELFYLGGPASLAVVPIHYFFIHILQAVGFINLSDTVLVFSLIIATILCFITAKQVAQLFKKMKPLLNKQSAMMIVWLSILLLAACTYLTWSTLPVAAASATLIGQLLICLLFVVRR